MIEVLIGVIERLMKLKSLRADKAELAYDEVFRPTFTDLENVHANYLELFGEAERRIPSFDFLSRPGTHWYRPHNYVNFFTEADGRNFLKEEGREGEKLHTSLCSKGFLVDYKLSGDRPPIKIIFRERHSAVEAAKRSGSGSISPMPSPEVPPNVFSELLLLREYIREKRVEFEPVRIRLRGLVKVMKTVTLGTEGDLFIKSVMNYFPDGDWIPYHGMSMRADDLGKQKRFSSGATSVLETLEKLETPGASTDPALLNKVRSNVQELAYALKRHHTEHWENVSEAFAGIQAKRLRLW